MTFTVGFVTGATPDKWARIWRERSRERLEMIPLTEHEQERGLRAGELDMALVRLPIDRDGLHCIPLYEEQPVVVMGHEHLLSLLEEVTFDDLAEEQLVIPERGGWTPGVEQLSWPPMSEKEAVETVAAGTGVAIVPMSIARLHHRKDVVFRPLVGAEPTTVGLAWLLDNDDERVQTFIGIVRGRSRNSSRG
ncbi:LysR substrate binding domain-containing protein [Nocardioides albertanoniae]|uniref:LysR substrate binding domain-containing protein n=1 Tax=Nocardioides albertanoniae TaxID=1175486 RepID=A0A543A6L4_9ACTN|nr:LysR family substrate-binding domain-containing protein [Nocardioides albertanoniae]TQL68234.1 LysR substrate binding domain-containing protein [Nocardioides albertanoniae]